MKQIASLDLSYLEKPLMQKLNWSLARAKESIQRYKNFLILVQKHPKKILAPTKDIDEVWHNHILFTKKYFADCKACFGRYLHHEPDEETESQPAMKKSYRLTSLLYQNEFQEFYNNHLDTTTFW